MPKPVLVLAFANEHDAAGRYLRQLPVELRRLRQALRPAVEGELCEVVTLPNASLDDIFETFQSERYRGRIALFHYGGHAGSYELLLESGAAHQAGLTALLAGQAGLQLVFFNGCYTALQSRELLAAGVPAVVGTEGPVDDTIATDLATHFYQALSKGLNLKTAWDQSVARALAGGGTENLGTYYQPAFRDAHFAEAPEYGRFPWEMTFRPGSETTGEWSLPQAAGNPYFGLPPIPDRYRFPEEPYRFLARYTAADARVFFGRGDYVRDLYQRLTGATSEPLLLWYGQSGVGKSSLLEAGVFPRLEQTHQIRIARRDSALGLSTQLRQTLGLSIGADQPLLVQAWRRQSQEQPLLLVFDQVEEVFTQARTDEADELNNFLDDIAYLLRDLSTELRGKILLSYRKEFDAEIDRACREARLPKEKIFLDRLDRKGIIEVITGLTTTPSLRNKYRLDIEPDLPEVIADDLLVDRDSPLTPVLQIILTRLWGEQVAADRREFTLTDYQRLQREGILLDDFFQQQMEALTAWDAEHGTNTVASGLALDLLYRHTTELGTAARFDLEELRKLYQHRHDLLLPLVERCRAHYLLTAQGKADSALAHDTLAPIVRRELATSDRPGQRAARVLAAKLPEFVHSNGKSLLDVADLALVEAGKNGMRLWTTKERTLIEKSQAERDRRRRRNRLIRTIGFVGTVVIALLGVLAGWLWLESVRDANANALIGQALRESRTDGTRALRTINQALAIRPANPSALQTRNQFIQEQEFYDWRTETGRSVRRLAAHPASGTVVAVVRDSLLVWKLNEWQEPELRQRYGLATEPPWIHLTHDGRYLFVAQGAILQRWSLAPDGTLSEMSNLPAYQEEIRTICESPDGRYLFTGGLYGDVALRNARGDTLRTWQAHAEAIVDLSFAPDGTELYTAGRDGNVIRWTLDGSRLGTYPHRERVQAIELNRNGQLLATADRSGVMRIWNRDTGLVVQWLAHTRPINRLATIDNNRFILSASNDGSISSHRWDGSLATVYRGHDYWVNDVITLDDNHFLSAGVNGEVLGWSLRSKLAGRRKVADGLVTAYAPAVADETVWIGMGGGLSQLLDDLDQFDDDFTLDALDTDAPILRYSFAPNRVDSLPGHTSGVTALAATVDGSRFLSSGEDGMIHLWSRAGERLRSFSTDDVIGALAFETGTDRFAAAGYSGTVRLYAADREISLSHPELVSDLAFLPERNELVTTANDGKVYLWNLESATARNQDLPKDALPTRVAADPTGRYFAVGLESDDARVRLYAADGTYLMTFGGLNQEDYNGNRRISSLAFSADGNWLAAGSGGGQVALYDLATGGTELFRLAEFARASVQELWFQDEETTLVVATNDGLLHYIRFRNWLNGF